MLHTFPARGRVYVRGKANIAFQAVAQVNPTAQNTFLLLTALCSFFASGFIHFSSSLLQPACGQL